MKIFNGINEAQGGFPAPVVSMGNFDGVHRGHQHMFRLVQQRADALNGTSCVITFDPHPQRVLFPDKPFFLINQMEEKIAIIREIGIDALFCIPFTPDFAASPPHDFVKQVLVERLRVQEIYIGQNSRFGAGQQGTAENLARWGERYGFTVRLVPPIRQDGDIISSTRIRRLLHAGDVARAAQFLARPYAVDGLVVQGTHRGTNLLGYPTANIDVRHELIPRRGVYICEVSWGRQCYPAVINIGTNPTFQPDGRTYVEVHLLDFQADLYGQRIRVLFHQRLRDEVKFATYQDLMDQIRQDVAEAHRFFHHRAPRCHEGPAQSANATDFAGVQPAGF